MTSMTVLERGGELLKVDTLGRVRTSRARREAILDEFERSGGSGVQFAALLGIKYPTFASWREGRRRERLLVDGGQEAVARTPAPSAPVWLEAVLEKELPQASLPVPERGSDRGALIPSLRVRLPGGAEVEMTGLGQAPLLASLLRNGQAEADSGGVCPAD